MATLTSPGNPAFSQNTVDPAVTEGGNPDAAYGDRADSGNEMTFHNGVAVSDGRAHGTLPLRGFAGDGDLVTAVARLVANHSAGASLAG
jgi:hypothetical protein